MNWLDIVIIVLMGIGGVVGWRMGITRAVFTVAGLVLGIFLAARFSDDVAELFTDAISSDTVATVIAYIIIIAMVMLIARIIRGMILKALSLFFLKWVDDMGGLALGFAGGAIVAAALILGLAGYSYNFELPQDLIPGPIMDQVERFEAKEGVQSALTGSGIVPIFLDIRGALPADALGFVPDDFKVALDILEETIEEEEAGG